MASTEEILRAELLKAQETIQQQNEVLEQLSKPAFRCATIITPHPTKLQMSVIMDGGVVYIPALKEHMEYKRGDTVLINQHGFIQEKIDPVIKGEPSVVTAVDKEWVELGGMGGTRVALVASYVSDVKAGDKVLTDPSGYVVIHKMPEADKARFNVAQSTGVCWDDIGGQEEAKRQMIEAVELPLKQSATYKHYNMPVVKGVLLWGPPGCGKTLLAKATATAVASAYGENAVSGFMYVKGPELLDPYVGVTEANIRDLFGRARKHKEKHGTQAVIFIDEADALLGARGSNRGTVLSSTVVPSFLTEMDGLEQSAALVILATNRPHDLDPAVTREGRIDRKVRVARPDKNSAVEIFKLHMRNVPVADGEDVDVLAAHATEALYSDALVMYEVVANGEPRIFTLANLVSGSTVANIVQLAITFAMRRDVQNNTLTGITKDDVFNAVYQTFLQNQNVNHHDAILEFANGAEINDVRKVQYEPATTQ